MLKYLVMVTEDLIVAGVLAGMLLSYVRSLGSRVGRNIVLAGIGLSLIASVFMAYMLNTTNVMNVGYNNLAMFFSFIAAFILFVVFSVTPLGEKLGTAGDIVLCVTAAVMIFTSVLYSLPDVLIYPFNFNLSGNTVFSTDFIYRFLGVLFGVILSGVAGVASYKIIKSLGHISGRIFLVLALAVNALSFLGKAIQIMRTRMMIPPSKLTFNIIKLTLNYSDIFIYGVILCIVVAAIFLMMRNMKVTEEYENKAQLRKIKAAMKKKRRWGIALMVCAIISVVNLTAVDAYNNKGPVEAPVEKCEIKGDDVIVPLTSVEDGHLHRFGYKTDDDIEVKFIVVKKPGSTAYGVGLDACDICGDAGYYEKDDQIVCKRCDVVMNTNTIGFKGGCNPIVIDYKVENGQIIVPIKTLVEHKDEFK